MDYIRQFLSGGAILTYLWVILIFVMEPLEDYLREVVSITHEELNFMRIIGTDSVSLDVYVWVCVSLCHCVLPSVRIVRGTV